MAKRRTTAKVPSGEKGDVVRPELTGPLVDCIRYEAEDKGIANLPDCVRAILQERYKQLGWLVRGSDGKYQFKIPLSTHPEG